MMTDTQQQQELCRAVETAVARQMHTPRDFNWLAELVTQHTREYISATTLKRMWGYIEKDVTASRHSLDQMARFIGYRDWPAFVAALSSGQRIESNLILSDSLSCDDITRGQRLRLQWLPDREILIQCTSTGHFEVLESQNSKLLVGTTFVCNVITDGLPLYLSQVVLPGSGKAINYVAGQENGVKVLL